jgi:hypothetical protein
MAAHHPAIARAAVSCSSLLRHSVSASGVMIERAPIFVTLGARPSRKRL